MLYTTVKDSTQQGHLYITWKISISFQTTWFYRWMYLLFTARCHKNSSISKEKDRTGTLRWSKRSRKHHDAHYNAYQPPKRQNYSSQTQIWLSFDFFFFGGGDFEGGGEGQEVHAMSQARKNLKNYCEQLKLRRQHTSEAILAWVFTSNDNAVIGLGPLQAMHLHKVCGQGQVLNEQVQGRVGSHVAFVNHELLILLLCRF